MTTADRAAEMAYWRAQVHNTARAILTGERPDGAAQLAAITERFPDMTLDNAVMILLQRPDATRLRRWFDWTEEGRYVMHGEKGVRLFDEDECGTVALFDVAQTEATARRAREANDL